MGRDLEAKHRKSCRAADQHNKTQQLPSLPHAVLELILTSFTSTDDKKALRQTCKLFQQLLDGNLASTRLNYRDNKDLCAMQSFLQRMQHLPCFNNVSVTSSQRPVALNSDSLLQHLPMHLNTLTVWGQAVNLEVLKGLQSLAFLDLDKRDQSLTGLEHISGLTRLHAQRPIGSLALLAPTFKQLSISVPDMVTGNEKLTKLEALKLDADGCTDLFRKIGPLPLRHLGLSFWLDDDPALLKDPSEWAAVPNTSTCLTLHGFFEMKSGVLPASRTSFRLDTSVQILPQAVAALPKITNLEVKTGYEAWSVVCVAFKCLSKLTDLQFLILCLHERSDIPLDDLSVVPGRKGFKLDIVVDD